LSWLANERNVAVNTQRIALNALVFLYHKFFERELGNSVLLWLPSNVTYPRC
jgi:hypothetical protein